MAQDFLPTASEQTDGYVPSNLGDNPSVFDPLAEFAAETWKRPADLSTRPIVGRGFVYRQDPLREAVQPIEFEDSCSPVSGSPDVPELNLDCFRLQAYEEENANIEKMADLTIRATPDILARAIAADQAFGDIPMMLLSHNTVNRLDEAVQAVGLHDLSLVDSMNRLLAYESLHREEQRVWDYLEHEGLHPFVAMGQDGRVWLTVRLFNSSGSLEEEPSTY